MTAFKTPRPFVAMLAVLLVMGMGEPQITVANAAGPTLKRVMLSTGGVGYFEFEDKHGFSKPRRQAAMRFLRRRLLQENDDPPEPELTLQKAEDLNCTRSGQVVAELGGLTVKG